MIWIIYPFFSCMFRSLKTVILRILNKEDDMEINKHDNNKTVNEKKTTRGNITFQKVEHYLKKKTSIRFS